MRVSMDGNVKVQISLGVEEAGALMRAMDDIDHLDADREADRRVYDELVQRLEEIVQG